MFNRGDRVEVHNDRYAEPGQSLTGRTGEVTSTGNGIKGDIVTVRLDGETRSLGFGEEEVTRTK